MCVCFVGLNCATNPCLHKGLLQHPRQQKLVLWLKTSTRVGSFRFQDAPNNVVKPIYNQPSPILRISSNVYISIYLSIYLSNIYIYINIYIYMCVYTCIYIYMVSYSVFQPPPNTPPQWYGSPSSTPFPSICKLLAAFLRSSLLFARSLQHF